MKKILVLFTAICVLTCSFASVGVAVPPKKATEIFMPVGANGQKISLMDLSHISVKDFEALSGHHMNLLSKAGFKLAQKDLRNSINADGSLNSKKLEKFTKKFADSEGGGFHFGGFALGFFLGLIGVLIAYLIKDEKKQTRVKWAWIGLGILVVLELVLLLA